MVMSKTICFAPASSSTSCGVLQGHSNSTLIWFKRSMRQTTQFLLKNAQTPNTPLERKKTRLVFSSWWLAIYSWDNSSLSLISSDLASRAPSDLFVLNLAWKTLRVNNGSSSQLALVPGLSLEPSPFSSMRYLEQSQCTLSLLSVKVTPKINLVQMDSSWRVWSTFGLSPMFWFAFWLCPAWPWTTIWTRSGRLING